MRTTLDIADDVLVAAKDLGRREKKTAGQMISDLARRALISVSLPQAKSARTGKSEEFHGFRPFPRRGGLVSNEHINKLREEDAY
jgi:hypothetical protein